MVVYFSVLLTILFFCYFDKSEKGTLSLVISLLLVYLMISLQRGWGGDGYTYVAYFDYYHSRQMSLDELLEDERHGEIGFKLAFTILPTFEAVKLLFSAYYCIALYVLIKYYVPRKYWALFFIFMFIDRPMLMGSLSAIARTGVAVSSFIIGLHFLCKRKKLWYVLLILFASLFHKSALLFLPIVFLPTHPTVLNPELTAVALVVLALASAMVPETWSNIIESVLDISDAFESYTNYMDNNSAHFGLSLLIPFVVLWGYYLVKYASKPDFGPYYLILYCAFFSIILRLLPSVGLSGRLYFYLDYSFFSGMLLLLSKVKDNNERILVVVSLLFVYGRWFLEFWFTPYFHANWMVYHPFWL